MQGPTLVQWQRRLGGNREVEAQVEVVDAAYLVPDAGGKGAADGISQPDVNLDAVEHICLDAHGGKGREHDGGQYSCDRHCLLIQFVNLV